MFLYRLQRLFSLYAVKIDMQLIVYFDEKDYLNVGIVGIEISRRVNVIRVNVIRNISCPIEWLHHGKIDIIRLYDTFDFEYN